MKLFEPITIRGMELKNRIVMAAMGIGTFALTNEDNKERVIDYYGERAKGGAGGIILGAAVASYFLPSTDLGQPVDVPRYIEAVGHLVDEVHKCGAKMGIQLFHANQYPSGSPVARGPEWVAPSPKVEPTLYGLTYVPPGQVMRELTVKEIESIIAAFAAAAAKVKEIGADFVEFHVAHGHLPSQFFSPIDNHRRDKYGGDLAGRMRFGLECIKSMRSAVGDGYPLFCRISAEDEVPGGVTLADSVAYAIELEKAGVDCFDVTVGSTVSRHYHLYVSPEKKYPMGTFAHLAEAIKDKVKVPVISVGRINTSEVAEAVLTKGQADLVAIGRQLICDPHWPKKVAEGRVDEIIACDSCNTNCWGRTKKTGQSATILLCHRNNLRPGETWPALMGG